MAVEKSLGTDVGNPSRDRGTRAVLRFARMSYGGLSLRFLLISETVKMTGNTPGLLVVTPQVDNMWGQIGREATGHRQGALP